MSVREPGKRLTSTAHAPSRIRADRVLTLDVTAHSPRSSAYERALDDLYRRLRTDKLPVHLYQVQRAASAPPAGLLARLANPQTQFPAVHIAGTKGKGSTAAMSASCLRAAGLRVGLYTSPHLQEFRDRIRILTPDDPDGRISESEFAALYDELRPLLDQVPGLTWFEIPTALAFLHFARRKVDVAVIEAGVGGRLDATNVVTSIVSVITTLGLDHTDILGETLVEIAGEKGGIIQPGIPVASAPQPPEALERLATLAADAGSPISVVGRDWTSSGESHRLRVESSPDPDFVPPGSEFELALAGSHQLLNAMVVLAALGWVRRRFPSVTLDAIRKGLSTAEWKGRLETVLRSPGLPTFVVDCAHCANSAETLARALRHDLGYNRLWLVFGGMEDKDLAGMMNSLFPLADKVVVVTVTSSPRAAQAEDLSLRARGLGYDAVVAESMADALSKAFALAAPGDLICATGCIKLVGEVLEAWEHIKPSIVAC